MKELGHQSSQPLIAWVACHTTHPRATCKQQLDRSSVNRCHMPHSSTHIAGFTIKIGHRKVRCQSEVLGAWRLTRVAYSRTIPLPWEPATNSTPTIETTSQLLSRKDQSGRRTVASQNKNSCASTTLIEACNERSRPLRELSATSRTSLITQGRWRRRSRLMSM